MSWDDCEMPEFTRQRISIARKLHKCCECHKPIPVGMKYWYFVGKWEGDVSAFKQHIECRDACYLVQTHYHECIPFGALREHIGDAGRKNYSDCTKEQRKLLATGLRASRLKTKEQIKEYNERHKSRDAEC